MDFQNRDGMKRVDQVVEFQCTFLARSTRCDAAEYAVFDEIALARN